MIIKQFNGVLQKTVRAREMGLNFLVFDWLSSQQLLPNFISLPHSDTFPYLHEYLEQDQPDLLEHYYNSNQLFDKTAEYFLRLALKTDVPLKRIFSF